MNHELHRVRSPNPDVIALVCYDCARSITIAPDGKWTVINQGDFEARHKWASDGFEITSVKAG